MTNGHRFKVGDKVVTTKPYDIAINGSSFTIPIGEDGVIENVEGEELLVDFPAYYCTLTLMASDVEPIQPLDRKTAFLRELQALLRKYDAKISYDTQCEKFEIYFCDGFKIIDRIYYPLEYPEFVDYEDDYTGYLNLDADNVMDFDKS